MKKLQNFINGKSVDSASGEVTTLINPATGQPFATAPISNQADVDSAMKAGCIENTCWEVVGGYQSESEIRISPRTQPLSKIVPNMY